MVPGHDGLGADPSGNLAGETGRALQIHAGHVDAALRSVFGVVGAVGVGIIERHRPDPTALLRVVNQRPQSHRVGGPAEGMPLVIRDPIHILC